MADRKLRTVLTGGGFFEGPRWHDGSWWVSDFYRHTVSRVTPDGAETVVVEVEQQPSGLGWLPDGSLVVVSMKDHRVLRYADGSLSTHADLTAHCGGHLNDRVVTEGGQVFAGDFGFFRSQLLWLIVVGALAWLFLHRHKLGNQIGRAHV